MIDLDIMPPDWKFAEQHAKAVKPGKTKSLYSKKGNNIFCQCCLKPVEKEEVPLCSNSKELEFLGFGFPLYFIFFKYSIILVMTLIFSYNIVSIYWAIQMNQSLCTHRLLASSSKIDSHYCKSFLVLFSRIQTIVSGEEKILRIASFITHLFALIYIRDNIRKTIEYYDEKTTSLSDYSLVIKKLPLKDGIQKDIRNFIDNHFKEDWRKFQQQDIRQQFRTDSQKIMEIILIPNLKEYYMLKKEKNKLIEEKRKFLIEEDRKLYTPLIGASSMTNLESPMERIDQKIRQAKLNIENCKGRYRQKATQDKLHAEMAIVVMNTELHKNVVIDFGEENKLNKKLLGKYFGEFEHEIEIEQASEPNEIIWHNLHYSSRERLVAKLIGWSLSVVFIAIVTVIFYFILNAKADLLLHAKEIESTTGNSKNSPEYTVAVFLAFLIVFLIILFNELIMDWVLHQFTNIQKHQHTSDQESSFALKSTLGLFFTTSLMTLVVEAFIYKNFFEHVFGVIEEQSIMFIVSPFLLPLLMLINPQHLNNLVMRRFRKDKKYFTQSEANQIMSDNPYTMGKQIAQIIETLWFTFLYATVIPLGAFITFLGLGFYYWMSKYNLLRRSSLSHNISGEMAFISLKLLDITLIMKPIGQLIFDTGIRDGFSVESIVLTCVAFLYIVLPMNNILQFFHEQKFKQQQKTYKQVKDTFLQTYETLHPIFKSRYQEVFNNLQMKISKRMQLTELQIPESILNSVMDNNNFLSYSDLSPKKSNEKMLQVRQNRPKVFFQRKDLQKDCDTSEIQLYFQTKKDFSQIFQDNDGAEIKRNLTT